MSIQAVYINRFSSIHPTVKEESLPYLKAEEPDYKAVITNPGLRRRMSRIIKMGVACGLECLDGINPEEVGAIITGTGLGCLADTEKFLNNLLDHQEGLLNPTAFIQSTFNTIAAQIALLKSIRGYNMTYVHREWSFESALLDGMMRISEGDRNVLVGALDEITLSAFTIRQRMGAFRNTIAGEGAHFFLLGKEKTTESFAVVKDLEIFTLPAYQEGLTEKIKEFLTRNGLTAKCIHRLVTGETGKRVEGSPYQVIEESLFGHASYSRFKERCGEYPVASAFAVWEIANTIKEEEGQWTLVYNFANRKDHSLILIGKC